MTSARVSTPVPEAGNVDAMNNLGVLFKQRDRWPEAEHWLRAAAGTGDRDALFNLGNVMQATGRISAAADCFSRSAKAGHVEASLNLGLLHLQQKDVKQAKRAFRKAARQGHPAGDAMLAAIERAPERASDGGDERLQIPATISAQTSGHAPPVKLYLDDLPRSADGARRRAQETDDPEMLDMAIDLGQQAMTGTEPGSGGKPWQVRRSAFHYGSGPE